MRCYNPLTCTSGAVVVHWHRFSFASRDVMNFPVSRADRHDPLNVLIVFLALAAVIVWLLVRS